MCVIASGIDTAMSRPRKVSGREQNKTVQKPAALFADFPGSLVRPDVDIFPEWTIIPCISKNLPGND